MTTMEGRSEINWKFLFWYLCFGLLHELSHAAVAMILGVHEGIFPDTYVGTIRFLIDIIIGRAINIPQLQDKPYERCIVRHQGWVFSLLFAIVLSFLSKASKSNRQNDMNLAAWATALEAITTDLLCQGNPIPTSETLLFCGNFGVIMVSNAWVQAPDNGKSALDLLQKMIEVTMMRGAQTGGVVSWASRRPKRALVQKDNRSEYYSIRSRVVNGKRSDLSLLLRTKVEKDAFDRGHIRSGIRGFFGHTRFATSSIAELEGTHPHQWCPGYDWRVYSAVEQKSTSPKATRTNIENFITHNGDLDFFQINKEYFDFSTIQKWLEKGTGVPMPSTVDSAAIAGLVDIIRSAGSFSLSARYALLLGLRSSKPDHTAEYPQNEDYEKIGTAFECHLYQLCQIDQCTIHDISNSQELRQELVNMACSDVVAVVKTNCLLTERISIDEEECTSATASVLEFVAVTVDAFFDNDLMHTTRLFIENAKGSFGLMVTSSLDAKRQICIAARGQTMSVGFFPETGLICYGSEQAAVKAGLDFQPLNGKRHRSDKKLAMATTRHQSDRFANETARMDLDDLAGEVCLLDWGEEDGENNIRFVSQPYRHYQMHQVLRNTVNIVLHRESVVANGSLYSRMTLLRGHELVKPLPDIEQDPILQDINDIPRICKAIQDDWQSFGLNRMTAWHLRRCLVTRLNDKIAGRLGNRSDTIDILVTGCEVSLWIAEQFASDLKKAFPLLGTAAISSNKLLGVFGQTIQIPATNFPISQQTCHLDDAIVIIVSHSGGTFAPLACANLLQSETQSIFVVSSEWDTQIGKQLRTLSADDWGSRIFSTEVGVRPAEPCSVSVAATHQLLTQIFEFICLTVLSKREFRRITNAAINETDLKILEKCNRDNIYALVTTVGVGIEGEEVPSPSAKELREAGRLWSDHILENARAYVMSIIYIVVSVTVGFPLVNGVVTLIYGEGGWVYLSRFVDSLVYLFLPQINVLILRIIQQRHLRHRMTARTIAIGDIPWVAQSAEAFLSKIFACSYSIAGINVLSGNPVDHFVHRHTHRVVRGTLLACGRPDGRLSALTSTEAAVCLSVNQASSIQSIGGSCESITIGHNPSPMSLTKNDVFLQNCRPSFMCEKLVGLKQTKHPIHYNSHGVVEGHTPGERLLSARSTQNPTGKGHVSQNSSPHYLLGIFMGWTRTALEEKISKCEGSRKLTHQEVVVERMIAEKHKREKLKQVFELNGPVGDDQMTLDQFLAVAKELDLDYSPDQLYKLFEQDDEGHGMVDLKSAKRILDMDKSAVLRKLDTQERSSSRPLSIELSMEAYFGEDTKKENPDISDFEICENQQLGMELYESRIASLQRFVAFTVMFHELGTRVQRFFPMISFGFLGYRTDRSHSIMRIATTASPVSGADVRDRIKTMKLIKTIRRSVDVISSAWYNRRAQVVRIFLRSASGRLLLREASMSSAGSSSVKSKGDVDRSRGKRIGNMDRVSNRQISDFDKIIVKSEVPQSIPE